jgi:hypothetical protein
MRESLFPFKNCTGGWLCALLAWAILGLASVPISASVAKRSDILLDGPGAFRPGEGAVIRWGALPQGTAEFELLLQCEEPIPIVLRLTGSQDPDLRALEWRVPNIPCDRARVIIRSNWGGREILLARSEPFQILVAGGVPLQRVDFQEGELWVREGLSPGLMGDRDSAMGGAPVHRSIPFRSSGSSRRIDNRASETPVPQRSTSAFPSLSPTRGFPPRHILTVALLI